MTELAATPTASSAPAAATVASVSSVFTPEQNITEIIKAAKKDAGISDEPSGGTEDGSADGGESVEASTANKDDKAPEKDPKLDEKNERFEKLKKLADDGKFEEVWKELGIDPDGARVPSKRFVELREATKRAKAEIAAERTQAHAAREEVKKLADEIAKAHEGFAKAKALYEKGDVAGALENAFGEKFDKIIENALLVQGGKDPELIALKRREERREREAEEQRQEAARKAAEAQQTQAEANYLSRLGDALTKSEDPVVAKAAASDKDFARAVYRAQQFAAREEGNPHLTHEEAAQRVLETIQKAHLRWTDVFGSAGGRQSAENTARAGITPSITDPTGRTSEAGKRTSVSRSRAPATPSVSPENMTEEELVKFFGSQMGND